MSKCMIDMFETTVSRFPNRIAVADEKKEITFAKLKKYALEIANRINGGNAPVGVMAHRDVYTIPMFFGIMYSGRCYVPIDPDMPVEKMKKIIKGAEIETVLSFAVQDRETVEACGAEFLELNEQMFVEAEKFVYGSVLAPRSDDRKEWDCQIGNELAEESEDHDDLLYLIYTSGSTGTPKGVAKSHEAMKSFVDAYLKEFSFDEHTIIGNQTPFCFDASAKDIYVMAACGATIEIIPTTLFSFPIRLMEYMDERKINFISWVPSALSIVTALNTFSERKPKYLKRVFFVGEVFPAKHLNRWMTALPHVEYVNLYGSSEICGISCFYRVKDVVDPKESIPAGAALSNCNIKLVSDGAVVNGQGISGEIYVSSEALANEYYKDEEKTKESFVYVDFGDGKKRYYRTGDIARYNPEGQLVFVARSDYQIKHMGHRIELGEIETAAMAITGIDKCCCLYNSKRSRIMLYVQPENDAELTDKEIRASLKEKLSDYMIPHKVTIMESLPLNANGKIDRAVMNASIR